MSFKIPLRQTLSAGEQAAGAWLTLPSTAIAGTIARTQNVSWVLIDAEHGLINDTHLYDLANVIAANGASPIIRVPSEETWLIKERPSWHTYSDRALDSGAHGLMVPMANSAEIVRGIVRATKYPPVGIRGFGPMFTSATGALGGAYAVAANNELVISVQIEHPQAVAEIEEICQEGIDVVFIGPFDLALSMGVQFGSEAHEAAISKILASAKKHGKVAAIFCLNGEQAAKRFAQGFQMVSVTTDIDTLTTAFANELTVATGKTTDAVKGYSA
ncbi:Phosphoenolpyruvate/pyruvate domain-containing protein [Lentinula lateritia]|nr:Phosphoenolpyruvate/pyruvate domain-containing protein [Lentinula lateritia]